MSECPHVTLKRMNVGDFRYYKCTVCHQKFQATEWDGKMKVVYPAESQGDQKGKGNDQPSTLTR